MLSKPIVKVNVPDVELVILPVPVSEPKDSLKPFMSRVPPPITKAEVETAPPNVLATPACRVPEVTVVGHV